MLRTIIAGNSLRSRHGIRSCLSHRPNNLRRSLCQQRLVAGIAEAADETDLGQRRPSQSEHSGTTRTQENHRQERWRHLRRHDLGSISRDEHQRACSHLDHAGSAGRCDHGSSWLWSPAGGARRQRIMGSMPTRFAPRIRRGLRPECRSRKQAATVPARGHATPFQHGGPQLQQRGPRHRAFANARRVSARQAREHRTHEPGHHDTLYEPVSTTKTRATVRTTPGAWRSI